MSATGALLAIDPGTVASGWVVMDRKTRRPLSFGKDQNEDLVQAIIAEQIWAPELVVEMLTSYGAPVGRETLETCVWVGRFLQAATMKNVNALTMNRFDVKLELIGSPRTNDSMIRAYLVDRFAYGVPNLGKGTKAEPGWFYGFKADIWQAYALGVAWIDRGERVFAARDLWKNNRPPEKERTAGK